MQREEEVNNFTSFFCIIHYQDHFCKLAQSSCPHPVHFYLLTSITFF